MVSKIIEMHIKTNAPENKILEKGEVWKVAVADKPIGGGANRELVRFLEKELKAKVKIIRGLKSKKKLIKISKHV